MKILPVKLLCPALLAAALLSAGAGLIYGYANYNDCRCNQASPFNSDSDNIANCCSYTTSSWYSSNSNKCKTPCPASCATGYIKNTSISYSEDGPCCQASCSLFKCSNGWTKKFGAENIIGSTDDLCCDQIPQVACPPNQVDAGGGVCKTPCGSCNAPQVRNSAVNYSEDGDCCFLNQLTPTPTIPEGPTLQPITVVLCPSYTMWNGFCCALNANTDCYDATNRITNTVPIGTCYDVWGTASMFLGPCKLGSDEVAQYHPAVCFDRNKPGMAVMCCQPASAFTNPDLANTACVYTRMYLGYDS